MKLYKIIHHIRFKILYISSKYRWLERKITKEDEEKRFGYLAGMVSNEIRNFCFHYGKNEYTGTGALIDLGSWLGASVVPLAEGLTARSDTPNKVIHAYDAFIWYANMNNTAQNTTPPFKHNFSIGDSFLPAFKKQIVRFADKIVIHEGNLNVVKWNGEPVEYMLIDAMKDWDVALQITKAFYPFLISGKSVIIHEDFCHHYTSWIHLIHYKMREYFEPLNVLKNSTAVAFKSIKPLPPIETIIPENFNDFTDTEIENAFTYSLSLVSAWNKPSILAAKIMAFRHKGDYVKAQIEIDKTPFYLRHFFSELDEAISVIKKESCT